jgi:putative acetyltransferase
MCAIVEALTDDQIEQVRSLFQEYLAQLPLEFGYRNFNAEIDGLPGPYAPPQGKLLLATVVGQPVGCVGLRPFPLPHTCEMKRLYVRPGFRGGKLGRKLVERVLTDARALGYSSMPLDSHPPTMQAAIEMYRKFGFREIASDPLEPSHELIFMELKLS